MRCGRGLQKSLPEVRFSQLPPADLHLILNGDRFTQI